MSVRDDIVNAGLDWSRPGSYKPSAGELVSFFSDAGTEQVPSQDEAQKSLDSLVTGCYVGGAVKQWCGIFACSVAANAGLNVKWTLVSGQIIGTPVKKIWGNSGMQPGDIAVIAHYNHHFIIIDVYSSESDSNTQLVSTVEGNTSGQLIRENVRNASEIVAYYQIQP